MHQYTIGVDPDSKEHGVAIYIDGELTELVMMDLMALLETLKAITEDGHQLKVHIENVASNKSYWHNRAASKASFGKAAADMGLCRQAQIELTRALDFYHIPYQLHIISRMWKDSAGKSQFQRATGWTARSNEDTRSAAYFGYIGLRYW